jgi:hypothetical protein
LLGWIAKRVGSWALVQMLRRYRHFPMLEITESSALLVCDGDRPTSKCRSPSTLSGGRFIHLTYPQSSRSLCLSLPASFFCLLTLCFFRFYSIWCLWLQLAVKKSSMLQIATLCMKYIRNQSHSHPEVHQIMFDCFCRAVCHTAQRHVPGHVRCSASLIMCYLQQCHK